MKSSEKLWGTGRARGRANPDTRAQVPALLKQEWVGWALIDQRLAAANNRYGAKHATKLVLSERTYGYEEAE